jgi:hypothetical protein
MIFFIHTIAIYRPKRFFIYIYIYSFCTSSGRVSNGKREREMWRKKIIKENEINTQSIQMCIQRKPAELKIAL